MAKYVGLLGVYFCFLMSKQHFIVFFLGRPKKKARLAQTNISAFFSSKCQDQQAVLTTADGRLLI